jgi:transcriptional regulator with XRE-family HTH domain
LRPLKSRHEPNKVPEGELGEIYIQVGNTLRNLRLAYGGKGLSQAELGRAIHIPANTISRWETGIYRPSLIDLETLANFFGVPMRHLFPDDAASPQQEALLSASSGLNDSEMNELIRYALFKRATTPSEKHKVTS